jgi:riboflavin synthase
MFTGIIECTGKVLALARHQHNITFTISAPFTNELKVDQSIAHNGVCLTVTSVKDNEYTVTAIDETLSKTNLSKLKAGDTVNLERCLKLNDRLDGHMVQGHVDITATCTGIEERNGSWLYSFEYNASATTYCTVEKGSVCVNGVSLTVVNSGNSSFSVAIIPYTYEHTNFNALQTGDTVNMEFDIIGKYVAKLLPNKI